jgi:hypothetical protein
MLSQKLVQAVMQPNTGEVFLLLVTFNHSSFPQPIYLVNNLETITSRGKEFMPFPIDLVLPPDDGDTLPSVQITCQNASLELIDEVRSVQGPMSVTIEMVLASSPDFVEASINDLRVASAQYDKNTIQLTATVDDLLNTSFPKEKYQPGNFPGLFK